MPRLAQVPRASPRRERAQCQVMTNFTELIRVPCDRLVPVADPLRLAVAAYLARFKGSSREHTESDLRCYLAWCAERGLDPLAARRPHLKLYIRWMQQIRQFKPSTVSRRFSVTAGFCRTRVIDGLLEHSPTEHLRRPAVPAESPTLGFTHLQFEALANRSPAIRLPRISILPLNGGVTHASNLCSSLVHQRSVNFGMGRKSGPRECITIHDQAMSRMLASAADRAHSARQHHRPESSQLSGF
jgi:hypothetical protein